MSDDYSLFNARSVNVAKIVKSVDCEILVEECLTALRSIEHQEKDKSFPKDERWRGEIERVKMDLASKIRLLKMKHGALEKQEAKNKNAEDVFAMRFVQKARELLPADTYSIVFSAAVNERKDAK